MRASDAANRIGVSRRTIFRWIKSGQLRASRVLCERGPAMRYDITVDALVEADDQRSEWSLMRSQEAKRRYAS